MGRRVLAVALGALVAFPAASHATVTIGSNLGREPDSTPDDNLTGAQETLPAGAQAAGGVTSPVNGVVTLWRARAADTGPLSLKVVRPVGGGLFTGAGTSSLVTPAPNNISSFASSIPISIGDRIGIHNTGSFGSLEIALGEPGSVANAWVPALIDGGPGRAPSASEAVELTVNADIEPTSAFTIEKVQKLKKSRLRVTVDLPNPGTLTAGDSRDASTASAAAKKKKKKKKNFLRRSTATATAPGQVTLIVRATKAARKALKRKFKKTGNKKAKVKAKLKLSFTPPFGAPATNVTKAKLRR